jgi:hypothetical protein
MFSVSASDLYFPRPHDRIITNTVRFTNTTGVDAVVKMRTTARDKFHVRPRVFAVRQGASVEVHVSNRVAPIASASSSGGAASVASAVSAVDGRAASIGASGSDSAITDADECHAVIHQLSAPAAAASAAAASADTSDALQRAWDEGAPLGRVVLHCRVTAPPASSLVTYATANSSASPSSGGGGNARRSASPGAATHQQPQQPQRPSAAPDQESSPAPRAATGPATGGRPPLAGRGTQPPTPHVDYARDPDVAAARAGGTPTTAASGAALERAAAGIAGHEAALARGEVALRQRADEAAAAARAALQQAATVEAAVSDGGSSGGGGAAAARLTRVPLSVTVLCMVVAFIVGVLLRQSAAHDEFGRIVDAAP